MMYVGHVPRRDAETTIDFTLRLRGEVEVLALVEAGVPYHQTALAGAMSVMPGHVSTLEIRNMGPETVRELREKLDLKPTAVLAIGDMAARLARRNIRDIPVVYSMVPAPMDADLTTTNLCGVPLNGGFDDQIEHLRNVLPEVRRIGTVIDPHRMGRCLREVKQATSSAGIDLIAADVFGDRPEDLTAALSELGQQQIDAFVLLLDPQLMDGDAYEQITRFVQEHDLVLAVPDASLVVSGKSFSFVPGFWDLGAYSGQLVRRIVEGKVQPSQIGVSYPTRESLDGGTARLQSQTYREVLPGTASEPGQLMARDE
jgi:ABC-type uncharacterized transport system substrate-binding protein